MIVHLVDGTYELFRHFFGLRRALKKGEKDPPFGAVTGVLGTIAEMIESGATHLGVATDHVIESFRNDLWAGYKTAEGIEPALWKQFHPLEEALVAMGVTTWAQVETEADDALASAAHLAALDNRVDKVCIWTPDKDLGQAVRGDRVVQMDRRSGAIRDEAAVRRKFGVAPEFIADWLALVGDAADGYPGIPKVGAKSATVLIEKYGHIEDWPESVLPNHREDAMLFKQLATLRIDLPVFRNVDELHWQGPTPAFEKVATRMGAERLLVRVAKL
jgi:5'-3' exonuclease